MNRTGRTEQAGMALVLIVFAVIVILGAATLVSLQVVAAQRATGSAVRMAQLEEACHAAIDLGISQIWNDYIEGNGNTTGNLASYHVFINAIIPPTNGNGGAENMVELITADNPLQLPGQQAVVTSLALSRFDDLTGCNLAFTATAEADGQTLTLRQSARVSGTLFRGFEYAVLANNINCIMCHAEFRPLDLENSLGDPSTYGDFDRIKVATLESLLIRPGTCDSNVAGTLYTRGIVTNESGQPLSANQIRNSSLRGYEFDRNNGKLAQNASGGLTQTRLAAGAVDSDGVLEQFANLYTGYPDVEDDMTDGPLPMSFPAPFGDDNENRYVDDFEFDRVMNAAAGQISGGVAYGVPNGGLYEGAALPSSSNDALAHLSADGVYDGNLVLVGTEANPIQLDGDVAINGDLVIAGPVKGWGQLLVRGNTYVVGDVTYADAPGSFGVAADGTENGLALVSGGSILMGDYLTVRGKNHTLDADTKYPDHADSIDVRRETASRNRTRNGVTETLRYGYFDPGAIDPGGIFETMIDANGNEVTRTGQQFSFTTSELMLFNNLEVDKHIADPSYLPRFYGLRESQPTALYAYDHPTDEHSVRYDEAGDTVKLLSDYLLKRGVSLDVLDNAAFHYMSPSENWISEETLRQIWWNDEMSRPASGRPFQFDGLLYSNNAIFGIVRSRTRHKSHTDGKMIVRGAIVCPDLGILAAGDDSSGTRSFQLFYDRRTARFWRLEDPTQVEFRRLVGRRVMGAEG